MSGGWAKVVVIRNAPDWKESARVWREEGRLDPPLFLPNPLPPSFPRDVVKLILKWNEIFKVDFFSVREKIKHITSSNFLALGADRVATQNEFFSEFDRWSNRGMVFFTDDDDCAIPGLFAHVERYFLQGYQCVRWSSVSVGGALLNRRVERRFPRIRPWLQYQFEIRPRKLGFLVPLVQSRAELPGTKAQLAVGPLHTNNYIMDFSKMRKDDAMEFVDHVNASRNIWKRNIKVESLEYEWLSFTNKHLASITEFRSIVNSSFSDSEIRQQAENFVMMQRAIRFPDRISWMQEYHDRIVEVFEMLF